MSTGLELVGALALCALVPLVPAYIWLKRIRPELAGWPFVMALGLGSLSVLPALLFQQVFPLATGTFAIPIHILFHVALTEELSRYLVFRSAYRLARSKAQTGMPAWADDQGDGAKLGLIAGLGFVLFENLVYIFINPQITLLRFISALPLHAACASHIGASALLGKSSGARRFLSLVIAVAIHGAYDLLLSLPFIPLLAVAIFALAALALAPAWRQARSVTDSGDL